MQVKWKMLCSLGLLFWVAMCTIDHIFGNIINNGEFSKFTEVEVETISEENSGGRFSIGWQQVAVWSLFSFFSSFILCFVVKLIQMYIKKRDELKLAKTGEQQEFHPLVTSIAQQEITEERAIIELTTKEEPMKISVETCTSEPIRTSSAHNILELKTPPQKYDLNNEHMNNAIKKVMAKKVEAFNKEKRDLLKKMSEIQKENKQIKDQLDDILSDRTLLIKRLECATREIKLNTNSKQLTLDKLEQAITCSNDLKSKLYRANEDRLAVEEKYKLLESQHKCLLNELNRKEEAFQEKLKLSHMPVVPSKSEESVQESEEDIQKVQMKLVDLEKSLEKMKLMTSKTSVDYETFSLQSEEPSEIDHQESCATITEEECCTHSSKEIPFHFGHGDEQVLTVTTFNDMCEQHLKPEEKQNLRKESSHLESTYEAVKDAVENEKITENISINSSEPIMVKYSENERCLRMVEYSISSSDSSTSTSSPLTDTTSETNHSDTDYEIIYTPGILSQSPAFQQFLMKVMDTPSENSMHDGKSMCPIITK